MDLTSPAFMDNGPLPDAFTKAGGGTSPPIRWTHLPTGARELALVLMDTEDNFIHWFAYAIPSNLTGVPGGLRYQSQTDAGELQVRQGRNSLGNVGYEAPLGTAGRRRTYALHAYALDAPLGLPQDAEPKDFFLAAKGHILAQATLHATYERGH